MIRHGVDSIPSDPSERTINATKPYINCTISFVYQILQQLELVIQTFVTGSQDVYEDTQVLGFL